MALGRPARVTIGLPVFNGERHLRQAIESVLTQDYDDLRLVIGDNASTDGTLDLCRSYAERDPRVTLLESDVNRGAAWNFNRLVDHATGDYFRWLACDDYLDPRCVGVCVDALDRQRDAVLVHTGVVDVDDDGEVLYKWDPTGACLDADPVDRYQWLLRHSEECFEAFGLIRLDALRRTKLIGPYSGSDHALLQELALLGRYAEIDERLFFHREHAERSMRLHPKDRGREMWFDTSRTSGVSFPRWRMLREFLRAAEDAPLSATQRRGARAALAWWALRHSRMLSTDLLFGGAAALRRR